MLILNKNAMISRLAAILGENSFLIGKKSILHIKVHCLLNKLRRIEIYSIAFSLKY